MSFHLFKGATRSPSFWNIPFNVFLLTVFSIVIFSLLIHLPPLMVSAVPIVIIEHIICLNDDKAFRIWWLHFKFAILRRWLKGKNSVYTQFKHRDQ